MSGSTDCIRDEGGVSSFERQENEEGHHVGTLEPSSAYQPRRRS